YRALLDQYDARRVVVSGDSCGGGLAVSTLLTLRSAGDPLPAGVFLISPLLDFAAEGGSATTNDGIDPLISKAMVVEMGKVYIGDIDPHEHPTASPLWGTHESLPPMYLTAGSTEVVRDDAARLAASVVDSGGEATLELADGMVHIWTLFPFLPEATATMTRIGAFVRSCID
ncbi:MAG: putative lipase/esterase, partial [Aeromicrobium sp.]|nr:putative lipase/esterase [Aeromicrobium sp.]